MSSSDRNQISHHTNPPTIEEPYLLKTAHDEDGNLILAGGKNYGDGWAELSDLSSRVIIENMERRQRRIATEQEVVRRQQELLNRRLLGAATEPAWKDHVKVITLAGRRF